MEKDIDFILVNFANPDMVGHTGNYEAAVKAVMTVDICLGKLLEEAENNFYKVIITADHGNIDTMLDEKNNPVTTHTLEKVPFIIVDNNLKLKNEGDLTNIAPTILEYMDIAKPKEMKDTESLIIK
jgi:2,3-bisphosphoglycerate-independent phosphoglycerate mutase